jgi:Uma2 family endonuclease
MGVSIQQPPRGAIVYPDSDGKPKADNTLQFRWIVTIKEGLDWVYRDRPDVFVAGDLLWYPVEGKPEICQAPDALAVFGRPKGDRGSYKQWEEGGIAPQVVFEVLSPNNRFREMYRKLRFYEEHGVEEYYLYDPDHSDLEGWLRDDEGLSEIRDLNGWTSPRLGVRFDTTASELTIYGPDGHRFLTYQELAAERERASLERDHIALERDHIALERDHIAQERETERLRSERMVAQLRALGVEPAE